MEVPRKRATKKRRVTADWRDTLFFWRGELVRASPTTWTGTWVGSPCGGPASSYAAPSSDAFASPDACAFSATAPDTLPLLGVTSSYFLDGSSHIDDTHSLLLPTDGDGVVAACGRNEYGAFISLGLLEGSVLTLARRYLPDEDARCDWVAAGPAAVLEHSGCAREPTAPWRALERSSSDTLLAKP